MKGGVQRWRLTSKSKNLHLYLACSLGLFAAPSQAQILSNLWRDAQLSEPSIAGADEQRKVAEERLFQAKAAFGPTAALVLNKGETRYNEAPAFDLRRFNNKQAALQITQPLYRSTLYFGLESAQAQYDQSVQALDQARSDATVRLIEACLEVLKSRDTISFLNAQQAAADEQLAAANRSFKVGRSPITDVRDAEAKVDTAAAQMIAARADLELKQQLLAELVGRPVTEILRLGLPGDAIPPLVPNSILEWIADAQVNSPQIAQAAKALVAAEAEVRKAWHGHAPTAELTYSYTTSSDTGTVTSTVPRKGNTSQVGINVTVPLLASGATQSKVLEAMAMRGKAQSEVDAARRTVQIGVRQSFTATLSALALTKGLETASKSQEIAFKANRRGYEVGVKANAEVLESQSKLFEVRRDLSRARYDAWLNYVKLKAFAGRLAAADLDMLDQKLIVVEPDPLRGHAPPVETRP